MSKINELKADIEKLPGEEVLELFRWLSEKDWENWDKEMKADSQAGRLYFLVREAVEPLYTPATVKTQETRKTKRGTPSCFQSSNALG